MDKINKKIDKNKKKYNDENLDNYYEKAINKISKILNQLKGHNEFKKAPIIYEIENSLVQITEFIQDEKTQEFNEIKSENLIDFKDESIINFFKSLNFILTENSKKKLNLLYFYIRNGYHILITGQTSTGKTYLSETVCKLLQKNISKYHCGENTKFSDLKFISLENKNNYYGITYIKGPLLRALTTKNSVFFLEGADLAQIEVLQALESIIDCGYLVYEHEGKSIKIDIPKDFSFILTANLNKRKFFGKRNELPESFKNKFIVIEFPEIKGDELYEISLEKYKSFKIDKLLKNYPKFIIDFISFHNEWSMNEKIQDDVDCLVIRNILSVLEIILEGEDPTKTIMNIYGARYIEPIKKEMEETLFKYESFKSYEENYEEIMKEFSKSCFINKNNIVLISSSIFSLKHRRNLLIAGNYGTGKKFFACHLADYFNEHLAEKNNDNIGDFCNFSLNLNLNKNNSFNNNKLIKNEEQSVYIVYCTKSSKVEDLIGKLRVSNNKNEDLIQWQDGPLIKAVREGKPLILIGIHELQSSVLEYMNDLLDRKYDGKQRYLNNQNNPNESTIPIHRNFRLICTTLLSEINKLSPAFATRMDIKILNDQLEGITETELLSLIKICMNNVKLELSSYEDDIKKKLELTNELSEEKSDITEQNLIKNERRKISMDSESSKKSFRSYSSKDSKKSNSSKSYKSSNDSKNSKESGEIKQLNKSRSSENLGDSDDESSKKIKGSNKSFSINEESSEDDNSKIEFNNNSCLYISDKGRLDKIISNNEIILNIKIYYEKYNKEKQIKMNIETLSKFIRASIMIIYKLNIIKLFNKDNIIKLVYDLMFSNQHNILIDEQIKKYILNQKLISDPLNNYFFIGINKLEDYMILLYLYSLMSIPINVYGPPGVGKTSGAECISRIRKLNERLEGNYTKYSFNSDTSPSDIFGEFTLLDNKIKLINGPLCESLMLGQTFIADEMNLSSKNTMMSLIPIFNSIHNRRIYFPGLQTPIIINPNFWFGAFQNYEGTAGRNTIPHELSLKLVRLDYPALEIEDIKKICIRIRDSIYSNFHNYNITDDDILQLVNFMFLLNEKKISKNLVSVQTWSIKNIKTLIYRMVEQERCEDIVYKSIQYIYCPIYINVLFYVLSSIDLELVNKIFNYIIDLVVDCFQINEKKEELRNIYYSKPEIYYDNSTKFVYLKKYISSIKFRNSNIGKSNIIFLNKIPSLLNALFNCLLCGDFEPILLIGPSGYKTYLIKLLINDVKTIVLNKESSIDTLIGSTHFFNQGEAEFFYISLICDIFDKSTKFNFLQQLKDGTLNVKDLKERINNFFSNKNCLCGKRIIFKNIAKNLYHKLVTIMEPLNKLNNKILSNYILEYKPGLLILSMLRGDSLNFKNISISTFEKLNESITGTNNLTLIKKFNSSLIQEDLISSFFTNFIRLFSTSVSKNFPEYILKSWTVITTREYELDELEEVLKIYSRENNFDTITQDDIKYLIESVRFFQNISNKIVSIKYLINAIELLYNMNKNLEILSNNEKEQKEKLYFINRQFIYYIILKSIIEQNIDNDNLSCKEINDKLYEYLFTTNKEKEIKIELPKGQSPFIFGNKNNLNGMKSLITNAFIPCIKNEYPKIKPAFTTKFVELLNIIHLGLSLNSTVVIEGQMGQGKQTAIKFLSEILGYKLLIIHLSNSCKEEDLFGKVIIYKDKKTNNIIIKEYETDLLKILKDTINFDERYLIVFNNLQNASDIIKEKIANICDKHQKSFLLPDGNMINKPLLNIICIINTEINSDIKNKLPNSLLYSTIYHKIGDMPTEDIKSVTYSIFNKYFEENSVKEAKIFIEKFNKVNDILKNMKSRQFLTFNDINYYAKIRAKTIKNFDIKLVDNIIFFYRTKDEEIIKELKINLNINGFDFVPEFQYNKEKTELYIKSNIENGEPLIIKVINKYKINIKDIKMKLNSLTTQQKKCLLFLACSWITRSKAILKGDTASGKTHCAILFSEMIGANLFTYQMNQDLNINIFTSRRILNEDSDNDEINLIKKYLRVINNLMPRYIKINIFDLIPNNPKEWLYSHFTKMFNILEIIMYDNRYGNENRKLLIEIKSKLDNIIGRYINGETQTLSGLINGDWFLFDDIQFANPDVLNIIAPLLSDEPRLNLFNVKKYLKYYIQVEESLLNNDKLINQNFNLIMTFNPKYCKNYQGLDPILENKCLSFNLLPNDYNYESCAQIYYGGLVNSNINSDIAYQLGGKLANVHLFAKKKSLENKEFFEGDSIFTSRTINRAVKYISNDIKEASKKGKDVNLSNIIVQAINKIYSIAYRKPCLMNKKGRNFSFMFREEIINNFKKDIDNYQISYLDYNTDNNIKLLEQLKDIQICIIENKQKEFKFNDFIEYSLNIKIKLIDTILEQIKSTIIMISLSKIKILRTEYLDEYYQISIVYKLLKNFIQIGSSISELHKEKKLIDDEMLSVDALNLPILRLKLLKKLLDNNILPQVLKREFVSKISNEEVGDNMSFDILSLISKLVEKPEMNSFINLIKYILKKKEFIKDIAKYIEIYIPYYKFNHTNLNYINIWLPLILKCLLKKQSFKIYFYDNIEFKYDSPKEIQNLKKLSFYFTQSMLNLSKNSNFEFNDKFKLKIVDNKNENDIFKFYYIINKILDYTDINKVNFDKEITTKINYKDYALSKDDKYKFFKISNLFNGNNAYSIGKFWMIIYNIDDKYYSSLFKLLTKYEQTIVNLFLSFYNNFNKENFSIFIDFIVSINFYTDNLIILNLEADEKYLSKKIKQFEEKQKLENFITILNNEKNKFLEINYFSDEIKKDEIINLYEQNIQNVNNIIIQNEKIKEKNILKNKFQLLYNNIDNIIITKNTNLEYYKKSLLEQINLTIEREEYDNESYEIYNNKFAQLKKLDLNFLMYTNINKFNIRWPIFMKEKIYTKSERAKFFEILIWYSKIKNSIDNIKKNENRENRLKYLLKLYEFEEMKFAIDIILSNEELIEEEFNLILSTLNSYYIIKMIDNNLEKYLFNCSNEINKILENNFLLYEQDITNKNDYYYIYTEEKEIDCNFLIQIPQFKPKDIVLLFFEICSKNKNGDYEIKEGPLLKKIKHNGIFDILKDNKNEIFNDNFGKKTAKKSAIEIIYILSKTVFKISESFEEFEKDIYTILNKLDFKEINPIDKQIINIFKIILNISIKIDEINSQMKIKLNYDDAKILKDEIIIKDINYILKYPKLIYVIKKYDGLFEDLKKYCKIPKEEYDSIPYWLILLRLLSNRENNILEHNQESNNFIKCISDDEKNYIQMKLIELKNDIGNKIKIVWLNLISNILRNTNSYNKKSRIIYDYIFYQIQHFPKLNEQIAQIAQKNLTIFCNEIDTIIFNQQLESVFDMNLEKDSHLINMICNPNQLYKNQIEKKYFEIWQNLINNPCFKKLIEFYKVEWTNNKEVDNLANDPFNMIYISLKEEIDKLLEQIDEDYIRNCERKIEKYTNKKINELNSILNDINCYANEIKNLNEFGKTEEIQNGENLDNLSEKNKIYEKFNYFIKKYEECLLKKEKDIKYIESTEKFIFKYANIELTLENIKKVRFHNELNKNQLYNNNIVIVINSKIFKANKEEHIKIDLFNDKTQKIFFYMPNEDCKDDKNLIVLKDEKNDINIFGNNNNTKDIYFKVNNDIYKRKIIIKINMMNLNKYENIIINKENIKNDIKTLVYDHNKKKKHKFW